MIDETPKTKVNRNMMLCRHCEQRLHTTFITRTIDTDKRRTFGTCEVCKTNTYCRRSFVGQKINAPKNPAGKNGRNSRTDRREDTT